MPKHRIRVREGSGSGSGYLRCKVHDGYNATREYIRFIWRGCLMDTVAPSLVAYPVYWDLYYTTKHSGDRTRMTIWWDERKCYISWWDNFNPGTYFSRQDLPRIADAHFWNMFIIFQFIVLNNPQNFYRSVWYSDIIMYRNGKRLYFISVQDDILKFIDYCAHLVDFHEGFLLQITKRDKIISSICLSLLRWHRKLLFTVFT